MSHAISHDYETEHRRSLADPEGFWGEVAEDITWIKPFDTVLDETNAPLYRWFAGGTLNTCYNALDRHVNEGRADQPALIYDSAMTDTKRTFTYAELLDLVARAAAGLEDLGVAHGDTVIIYMPMIPEAVVAMLACWLRIGAIHSVVFGGFAPHELAKRIDDANPKVIVSATCGLEPNRVVEYKPLLDEAIGIATHKVERCVVVPRPQAGCALVDGRDLWWDNVMTGDRLAPCVEVAATDPLYVLYTSGTTGIPKGVVRDNGGHAVALRWTMKAIYGINPGDVFWSASDIGWVVGHSYIVYGPLLAGATTILYEGKPVGTPDPGAFWRIIDEYNVKTLFTAPTAFRAVKREDPNADFIKKHDVSGLNYLFLAGERCDPDTLDWATQILGVPVIDHWWQTESGWPMAANCVGLGLLPIKAGSPAKAVPGWDIRVVDQGDNETAPGEIGNIVAKLPLPPGSLPTLFHNDDGYIESYLTKFPGYYETSDAGYMDDDGYIYVMSRVDDIINVAGHRLSTGGMEEVLAGHPDVAECAVIGVNDKLKGEVPLGLVVLKAGVESTDDQIIKQLVLRIREKIGPVAAFKKTLVVKRLPKTRSGKILRGTMKKIADGTDFQMPATIDDPTILEEITEAMHKVGLPQ